MSITQPEMEALLNRFMGAGSPITAAVGGGTTTTPAGSPPVAGSIVDLDRLVSPEQTTFLQNLKGMTSDAMSMLDSLKEGAKAVDDMMLTYTEPLRVASLQIQESFGGFRKANQEMSIGISQDLRDSYDSFATNITSTTDELVAMGKEKYVVEIDGADVNLLGEAFQDADVFRDRFFGMIEAYGDTIGPALASGLKDSMEDIALFQENFGLSSQQLGDFIGIEVARTGEATTTMMDDLKKFSYGMSAQTGISAKLIAKDTVEIVSNVKQFGNVTVEEAARMSTALKQLGVEYSQLSGMVGAFQGFDTAAQKVGNLSAVFGIHLDAVEMMHLANTDQEAMMFKLRDAFDASGQSLDDMNIAQKNLLAEQAGFTDINQMEMFFSGQVDSMEELQAMSEEAADEATAADAVEAFNKDLATLALQGVSAADKIDKAKNDLVYSLNSLAPEVMDFRSNLMTGIGFTADEVKSLATGAVQEVDKVKDALVDAYRGEGSLEDAMSTAGEGFITSISRVPGSLGTILDKTLDVYEASDFKSRSPSAVGENMTDGFVHALEDGRIANSFDNILIMAEEASSASSTMMAESGLAEYTELTERAGNEATATVAEVLAQHIEKIEEVEQLVEAPDKIVDILSNVGEMKTINDKLIQSLKENAEKPLKIAYESKGADDIGSMIFGLLKDHISIHGGQVVMSYPDNQ